MQCARRLTAGRYRLHHPPAPFKKANGSYVDRVASPISPVADAARRLFGSTILRIAYGIEVDNPGNERYLTLVEEGISVFNAVLVPGAFMVETFPFLRYFPAWFPGARYKHNVAQWKRDVLNVLHVPWEVIKGMMVSMCYRACVMF